MQRNKIRDKLIANIDYPVALYPIQNSTIPHSSQNLLRHQSQQMLTQSKMVVPHNSHMQTPKSQETQQFDNDSRVARSASQGKKRYLKVVSNPHQIKLHEMNSKSIQISQSRLKGSRVAKKELTLDRRVYKDEKGMKTEGRLDSINSVGVPVQGMSMYQSNLERQPIIYRQNIVPILVKKNTERPNTYNFFMQNQINNSNVAPNCQRPASLIPSASNHLVIVPHSKPKVYPHPHLHQQPINMLPQNIPVYLQYPVYQPQSFPQQNAYRQVRQDSRQLTIHHHSPSMTNTGRSNIRTPIRAFEPSPPSNQTTPVHFLQRCSLEKSQQIQYNKQIMSKLGSTQTPYSVYAQYQHTNNFMQVTPHQRVISLLSEPVITSQYPVYRTITKKQISLAPEQKKEIVFEGKDPSLHMTPPRRKQCNSVQCLQGNLSFFKAQTSANLKSLHHIKSSPKPIKNKEQTIKILQDSFHIQHENTKKQSNTKIQISQTFRPLKKSAFFEEFQQQASTPVHINNFINSVNKQIQLVGSQRKQAQSRISRRLQELSSRAKSIVSLCSQEQIKPAKNPFPAQPSLQIKLKQSLSLNQPKKHSQAIKPQQKQVPRTLPSNKQNNLQPQTQCLRNQILTRIFS